MTRWPTLFIALLCSVHVFGAPSPEPKFEYVNIRFETNTPEEHYNNFLGGTDPGIAPVTGQSPDLPLLERSASSSAATETDGNPFSNVAESSATEDLSSFSKDELESRRELLLAILEQTSAQLGESTPTSEQPKQLVNGTNYPREETKNAKLEQDSDLSDYLDINQYIPQKKTMQEQSEVKMVMSDDRLGSTSAETSHAIGIITPLFVFLSGMLFTILLPYI